MSIVYVENIPVEVTRKNVKRINMRISKSDASVRVSFPYYKSLRYVKHYIENNKDWILKSQKKIIELQNKQEKMKIKNQQRKYAEGENFYLWGCSYLLKKGPANKWDLKISSNDKCAYFSYPDSSDAQKRLKFLKEWCKFTILNETKLVLNYYENLTGLKSREIKTRFLKSIWGSCNSIKGIILINTQLIYYPKKYLNYVVLHELAHLKIPNHGYQFKDFLNEYMPDWWQIKKEMNNFSLSSNYNLM